jgi:AcrR family transcriptional regulator
MATVAVRSTAEERREQIIEAAVLVFADRGFEAASTDEIARRVGISQPYLFRLFRTKRELVLACIERCFRQTEELFVNAARGLEGEAALHAIGEAYVELIRSDPVKLRVQLQSYAACDDAEIRNLVAAEYGLLVHLVRRLSGVGAVELSRFFSEGMLLNVLAVMGQFDAPSPWAAELIEGCAQQ